MNVTDKICLMVTERELLDMLQEECAELIQAASKCKRVMDRDASVDPRKARQLLVEELGDVQNMTLLVASGVLTIEEANAMYDGRKAKMQRYYKRLKERECNGKRLDD